MLIHCEVNHGQLKKAKNINWKRLWRLILICNSHTNILEDFLLLPKEGPFLIELNNTWKNLIISRVPIVSFYILLRNIWQKRGVP